MARKLVALALVGLFLMVHGPADAQVSRPDRDIRQTKPDELVEREYTYGPVLGDGPSIASTWSCTVVSWDPFRVANSIFAEAEQWCTGAFGWHQVDGRIQRHRWFGWEDRASDTSTATTGFSTSVMTHYNCAGTGNHNYRNLARGRNAHVTPNHWVYSDSFRTTC